MELPHLLDSFFSTFKSIHTQKSYERDLKDFFLFCQEDIDLVITNPNQITEKLVFVWQKKLSQHSNATAARKLASLSSFLEFLRKQKKISFNFMKDMNRPQVEKTGKTNILTRDELDQILDCALKNALFYQEKKEHLYALWTLRYTVLYTLFSVGMRVEELCSLKINSLEHLHDDHWRLHMIAKGFEPHAPIIHSKTARILKHYIQQFRSFADKNDFLFVASTSKLESGQNPLHRTSVFHMIKVCAKEAGLSKNISPHSCRATLATLLHQNGVPIAHIQNLLNHKQMTTTSIYIKKSDELAHAAATKIDLIDLDEKT